MAQPLITILRELDDKIIEITAVHQKLQDKIAKLEEENDNLRQELEETRARLHKSQTDVTFLTMSHRLADSPDSLISTRRRIARLIRTVDKCISMLKEE